MLDKILENIEHLLADKTIDDKLEILNKIRLRLQKLSPQTEPVDTVLWVKKEMVQANEYNPNAVHGPEMQLLYTSIKNDGYTMPIVCYSLGEERYEIVDGFHRNRICREHPDISERTHGYLPITIIDKALDERMGSTVRHNRARGVHRISSMTNIVTDLIKTGWTDEDICKKLGMDREELLRFKQVSGLREAFANHEFSKSWEEFESKFELQNIKGATKTVAIGGLKASEGKINS